MTNGYMGKVLWVNVSSGEIKEEALEEKLCQDFLGGYGLGARVLFSYQEAKVAPLGPENILGFTTGPLTGTDAICGTRYTVVTKSPLTGTWGDANSGGDFGPYLKFTGYDSVFFTGISEKPAYLFIYDGKAELRDASRLWGKNTHDTEDTLKAELGEDVRIACIGQAGEKLSLISAIINNKGRAAGRSGVGAVMGSKKLKAIVVKGSQKVPVAHGARLKEARRKYLLTMPKTPWYPAFHDFGTCGDLPTVAQIGRTPIRNWGGSILNMPNVEAIGGSSVVKLQQKKYACWRCPIACGGIMKFGKEYKYKSGPHKPEYETLAAFGTMCLVDNLESIIMVNDLCNRYGLDTISAGSTIAFAMECYENEIITKKDTDGIELTWGNHHAMVAMAEKMAKREGFGDILADGVQVAAEKIGRGASQYAIHIQGQELPMHDPRVDIRAGFGCSYKTVPTPGRHTRGASDDSRHPLEGPAPFDRKSFENRGEEQKRITSRITAISSAGLCLFGYFCMDLEAPPEFLSYVTDRDLDYDDLQLIGERAINIQQAFNFREGLIPAQFKVPDRMLGNPPLKEGPTAGRYCDVDLMERDYYTAMDWDTSTGKPSKRKLEQLGLEDVATALYPAF